MAESRRRVLNWANLILKDLGLKRRTTELSLMLIDQLIFDNSCQLFSKQLLCISAILFVIKLERDYNENLYEFFKFLGSKLKIRPEDIYRCECFILSVIPDNFGMLVGFSELFKSFLCILEIGVVPEQEIFCMSDVAIDMYIKAECKLSIESLLVMLVLKAYFPKKNADIKKQKLMSRLKICREKEKPFKDVLDFKCKTVRLASASPSGS